MFFFALLIGVLLGIAFPILQNKGFKGGAHDKKIFNAILEKSNLLGDEDETDFGHIGNWDERPAGIEEMSVSVKLIPSIYEGSSDFLLAYQAIVRLKPQADKVTKIFPTNDEVYFVDGYDVCFNFYLLDEDGYCLSEINTENQEKLHSSGTCPLSIKPGKKPELIRVVLPGVRIPAFLAKNIKKVCYMPVFSVSSGKPEKNKTIKE